MLLIKLNMKTPMIDRLLSQGLIWVEGSGYVGKAADGTLVQVGCAFTRKGIKTAESYLTANPTPDKW